jgi:hypothetical protein
MISDEQVKKFQRQLRKGVPDGEIRAQMKREGYSAEDINRVFVPHRYDMRSWYLTFAIVISVAGLIIFSKTGGFIILILGALLFLAYFKEIERLKRQS